ncbi:protein of unknown function [Streptococcus thermophilus]|nr:protein of unknown function [Streptococcus thermophilus]
MSFHDGGAYEYWHEHDDDEVT